MPRQVDHDLRRRQITRAVWRLATRGGLEHVTLRQVAAEDGTDVDHIRDRDDHRLRNLQLLCS
ncbi:hypothetical protein [Nocardiopsis tropica]|uniref:HNH endonuclease n=1 Tax=Nocardiopsis tropica TaxID=109330 RepID=A0ABU7KV88_9ACTN|nr:hypothetical protein [Nocardiopsis umidischolae]MEE2053207.1 hypothetical protein [Nocardiopsis umidischolae]